jgi:hypothetical protein
MRRRWAKPKTMPLSVNELRECRRVIRKFVRIYRIASANPQPTATERRSLLRGIKTAAIRFLKKPDRHWRDRLIDQLGATDSNTNNVLYKYISDRTEKPRTALIALKRSLFDLFSSALYPGECPPAPGVISRVSQDLICAFLVNDLPVVRALAGMDLAVLVPKKQRLWPDPALANLVAALVPVWCRVTGRTAALISDDETGETKRSPFAQWLGDLLEEIGEQRPPTGRVVDIVRAGKSKNPAPAT